MISCTKPKNTNVRQLFFLFFVQEDTYLDKTILDKIVLDMTILYFIIVSLSKFEK